MTDPDSPAGSGASPDETTAPAGKTLLGHPRGLAVLFFSEMWERFSFYGMRALLTLYMVKVLGYPDRSSAGVYGAYGALVYMFPVLGGWVAEQILGYRRAIIMGGTFMAIGHALMAIQHELSFYAALAFLCIGNGFFKPNISSTVGKLYREGDERRDSGFTIFYMGINLGALLAPWVCGPLGENVGWHWGFGAAAIGMVLGLIVFTLGKPTLEGKGEPRDPARLHSRVLPGISLHVAIWLGGLLLTPLAAFLLWRNAFAGRLVYATGAAVLGILIAVAVREGRVGRDRLVSLMILMVFHMLFWAFFEQAGSSLTLLTDRVVDRNLPVLGERPASWFQGVNPFFILLLAPIFSMLWQFLGKRRRQPSVPMKFALGLLGLGLGYGVLLLGISRAGDGERIAWIFIVGMYFLHTAGELCLSPVGLSAVTKLAPVKLVGFVMGAWFLTISFGQNIAGEIAKLTEVKFDKGTTLDELTRGTYRLGPTLADLVKGDHLKEPLTLTRVIEALGEKGIEPRAVIEHCRRKELISSQVAGEVLEIIGPDGTSDAAKAAAALDAYIIQPVIGRYRPVYRNIFYASMALGVLLVLLSRPIRKLMHGVE